MGQIMGTYKTKHLDLNMNDLPSFNTTAGFSFKRKQRQMQISEDHLKSARIPVKYRDYCAHLLMDYSVCRYKHMPFVYRCHHEKHAYLNCEHADYILRMKEFERERRLREREIRIQKKIETPTTDSPPKSITDVKPLEVKAKVDNKADCPK